MNELHNCPFCDNPVERNEEGDIDCPACAYTFYDTSEGNEWWNYRPIENQLHARIAELEGPGPNLLIFSAEEWKALSAHSRNYINLMWIDLTTAKKRIEELEEANMFIPVTERMPTDNSRYEVYMTNDYTVIASVSPEWWINDSGSIISFDHVVSWRKLPKGAK